MLILEENQNNNQAKHAASTALYTGGKKINRSAGGERAPPFGSRGRLDEASPPTAYTFPNNSYCGVVVATVANVVVVEATMTTHGSSTLGLVHELGLIFSNTSDHSHPGSSNR
jgi:hypothetical protein